MRVASGRSDGEMGQVFILQNQANMYARAGGRLTVLLQISMHSARE